MGSANELRLIGPSEIKLYFGGSRSFKNFLDKM